MSIYQMVDIWFVSRHAEGELAIAAITVVLPITFLISSFGMAIGVGGASVLARALGEGQPEKAQKHLVIKSYLPSALYFLLYSLALYFKQSYSLFLGLIAKLCLMPRNISTSYFWGYPFWDGL